MWDSFSSPGQQYYVGMTMGASGSPIFEYGTLADAGLPAIFVIGETRVASCTVTGTSCSIPSAGAASQYNADGTITIIVPKAAVGNPPVGDLLGAIGGRTLTGDTPTTNTLERSNAFVDHTFVKAQTDNSYPAATYTVVGNGACEGGIVPLSAVSRKTHDSISPPFDVTLPLSGNLGIECRIGQGPNADQHQVVVNFPGPITLIGTPTVSSGSGSVTSALASGNQVFINLTAANKQRIAITLTVNDGLNTGPVVVPMGVLFGDTTGDGVVNTADITQTRRQSGNVAHGDPNANFREDVTVDGVINTADITAVRRQSGNALP
jgi:dockerin type I repeat protein